MTCKPDSAKLPGCCNDPSRREFLQLVGAGLAAAAGQAAIAGPFSQEDFERLVPRDKKLSPEWLASLTARGEPAVYRGAELDRIAMPIGGLCAGQVYLGGDGRLWHWDIFNQHVATAAEHYARPMDPLKSPAFTHFALAVRHAPDEAWRSFARDQWEEVTFKGQYPLGFVEYRDPAVPLAVSLEAFSPFVPLAPNDSTLPATVIRFTLRNTTQRRVDVELAGSLENAVCRFSGRERDGLRRNRVVKLEGLAVLECSAEPPPERPASDRPDIVLEDFEKETYAGWEATGTAFGGGPVRQDGMPDYQGAVGGAGERLANSHASAPGKDVAEKDAQVGTLVGKSFKIERDYLNFLIGGGAHAGRTCLNLLVEDKPVASATGKNDNRLAPATIDLRRWQGKMARIELVDNERGGWGNLGVDQIALSDRPAVPRGPLSEEADFGTMCLALLAPQPNDFALPEIMHREKSFWRAIQELGKLIADGEAATAFDDAPPTGVLLRRASLAAGQSATVTFLVTWHFPNLTIDRRFGLVGRQYAKRFASARAVAEHLAMDFQRLDRHTHLWHATWYDSTLPHWFLDRTFLNTSILATSTCYLLGDGRFYAWEGVGCCPGTCGHVWQYAQAMGRLFPSWERKLREEVDFRLAMGRDGAIAFRGEFNDFPAVDAQAGAILRAYREHRTSADDEFLRRNWPRIKNALEYLLSEDANGDGLLEGKQHNTLDTDWYGPVAWLSGLYLAALAAGAGMARERDELAFADRCRQIVERGQRRFVARLFDGEYFVNRPDPKRPDTINSGSGCHIDQVLGQSWAFQAGLGRVLPEKETRAALAALWRYNFTPDVGPYRKAHAPGRWYAMPGEGGLLMCTFPRADWQYEQAKGKGPDWAAGYFNECMNGFEYQVAGHMIWEGMLTEGLAIARMVHDRYHPSRRNPWNEIECGDHYARSMASYGVFLAACGFEYHGPKGWLSFAPRISPENFRAAFTAAEGWGTLAQQRIDDKQIVHIDLHWGSLRLKELTFELPEGMKSRGLLIQLDGRITPAVHEQTDRQLAIRFKREIVLRAGQSLAITVE